MKTKIPLLTLSFSLIYFMNLSAQNCQGGIALYSFNENNIDALLTTTGNLWWSGSSQLGYEFPAESGKHLLFTGGLWMGGIDQGGNLKLAAQTYGTSAGDYDFYPGPIDPATGMVSEADCNRWDFHFEANLSDNESFLADFSDNGQIDNPIPVSIQGWPAQGNPFFEAVHFFPLPDKSLAPFVDQNGDGIYTPLEGDYPKFKGSSAVWWVYNDIGNIHNQSNAEPIGMEIQAMAYAYNTGNDVIKNATFYEFKMVYYGNESLSNFHTSLWVDPDIGCPANDYIGCHPESNLGYAYNSQIVDPDCGGSLGYDIDIPMVGIKVLKNTITQDGMMSGFSYFFNGGGFPTPLPGTTEPVTGPEYFNYMQGLWADGNPIFQGGNGYNFGVGVPYSFVFDNSIVNGNPWTECTANLPDGDRRFLMNFGPTTLSPGQIQELNFAVVAKADPIYPCPEVEGIISDTDFISVFDSIQTDLQNNINTSGPLAAFSYNATTTQEFNFLDRSFFNPEEWTWDFGDGNTSLEPFPNHTYSSNGTFTVCLTVSNSIGTDTYCRDIFIQAAPIADFDFSIANLSVGFNNLSTNSPTSYLWDFGDGVTTTTANTFHNYSSPELYNVCLTAVNVVGQNTICKEVDLRTTSTNELTDIAYTLYPNPAQDFLYLNFSEITSSQLELHFFDVLGKQVNPKIHKSGSQFEIMINELPKGLYFFEIIEDNKKRGTGKFIVN